MKKNYYIITITSILIIGILIYSFVFSKKNEKIYKFNFSNGYTPGRTYTGQINLITGNADITSIDGCSLLPENCKDNLEKHYKGTIEKRYLEQIKKILESTDYKDNEHLIIGAINILRNDELCIDENDTKITCKEIAEQILFHNED